MKPTLASAVGLFIAFASATEPGKPAPESQGKALYEYHCATCHGEGPGNPGTAALARKYQGQLPPLLTERIDLTPERVKYFVRRGVNAMPFFRKTEISDAELDAIARYLGPESPTAGEP